MSKLNPTANFPTGGAVYVRVQLLSAEIALNGAAAARRLGGSRVAVPLTIPASKLDVEGNVRLTGCKTSLQLAARRLTLRVSAMINSRHGIPVLRAITVPHVIQNRVRPAGCARRAGECPERQRGRTVNPLAYAFVGSSPTSPTSIFNDLGQHG